MTEDNTLPRPIKFDDIREGDTIERHYKFEGLDYITRGVAHKQYSTHFGSGLESAWRSVRDGLVAHNTDEAQGISLILVDRPKDPPPPLPTEEGALILARLKGYAEEQLLERTDHPSYPWLSLPGIVYRDNEILSWRPAVAVAVPDLTEHDTASTDDMGGWVCSCSAHGENSESRTYHLAESWGLMVEYMTEEDSK